MNQRNGPTCHAPFVPACAGAAVMRRTLVALILSCSVLANGADSNKQQTQAALADMDLETLMEIVPTVTGATKYEQKTTEAPSSVTVITANEIKQYGHRTLADILQSVQGFHVSYDRNYSFLGARGVSLGDFNSRVLVLIDGHRINNNLTDGAFIDTAFILDVDLIDRVEIIRGPGSVLYGNNAFFGVINVITREGKQLNGAEFSGEYAEFDTYKGRVTIGKQFTNGVQMLLSGTYYDSDGAERLYYPEFDQRVSTETRATNNGVAQGLDDDSFGSFFGSLSYRDISLEGAFIRREKGNPTALDPTTAFNDPRLRTIDERSYAALKYAHSFPDVVDMTAQVYYDRNDAKIGFPQTTGRLFKEEKAGEWWGAELQLNKRLLERHIITLGAEYRDDFRQHSRGFFADTGETTNETNQDRQSYGAYVQGEFTVLTNLLHFNGGVRYDQYGDFDPAFNPRLALIYNPFEKSTIKALYGTAFRAPNFLELSDSRFQDIKPEEITAYELVYEQTLGRNLQSSVSGFINQMHDLIVLENGAFTNFDAQTMGIELALQGIWTNGIRARLSYSFQETENNSAGGGLPDSPAHLVKLNLSVPLIREKVFAGLEYQYTSSRSTLYTTSTGDTLPGVDAAGYGVINLTLFSQNLVKNLEFSASVYNLLDSKYTDPASRFHLQDNLERDGRSFRLKLTCQF